MQSSRPNQLLIKTLRDYQGLSKLVDIFRADKGVDLPSWRNFCFLPVAAWYSIVSNTRNKGLPLYSHELLQELQVLAAVGTWRYSQGIYQFDPDIYHAVIVSEIKGDLPSEVLLRLPEWCLYVETPSLRAFEQEIHGFFAYLEHDMNDGHIELRLLIDADKDLISIPLHLGDWTLVEAIEKFLDSAQFQALKLGKESARSSDTEALMADEIMPFISLILYICSEEPDISNLDVPDFKPSRPKPKKTKKGWRLFPADKPKFWDVGKADGEKIRDVLKEHQETGRSVKPHLRRGHYHTFWTGARGSDEQKAIVKWVMPVVVGAAK